MRSGHTRFELIVSAMLLTAIVSVSTATYTRLLRVWDTMRAYQLAMQELSNKMEQLTLLSKSECQSQLHLLEIDSRVQEAIAGCRMTGVILQEEQEETARLVLSFYLHPSMRVEPIMLLGWLDSGAEK
jgi:uncharacterized protein YfbU (UPF0304 family)